jgi:uncharacterized protein (TIGR00369 family)
VDLAISVEQARRIVDDAPFARWWGLSVEGLGEGMARVSLPWRADLVRPGGGLHGSSYEVVADVAAWLAIMTITGEEPMAVTIEMKTSFLRAAMSAITAEAKVLKMGRRVVFVIAEIVDAEGRTVAHSTLSYARAAGAPG